MLHMKEQRCVLCACACVCVCEVWKLGKCVHVRTYVTPPVYTGV